MAHDDDDFSLSERETDFIEAFSDLYTRVGATRMEGRLLAYLMVTRRADASSAQIMADLGASAGAVSTATRSLSTAGFILRFQKPGDRSYYFRAQQDMWGSFLAGEQTWADRSRRLLESVTKDIPPSDPRRERLEITRDYMEWLESYNRRMLADWRAYRNERRESRDG